MLFRSFNPVPEVEVPEGHFRDITLHDGSVIRLETISEEHDPGNAVAALAALHHAEQEKKHVTGLLYFNPNKESFTEELNLPSKALIHHSDDELRPTKAQLDAVNQALMG